MTGTTIDTMTIDTEDPTSITADELLARRLIGHINERDIDAAVAMLSAGYRVEWPDAGLDLAESFVREITMMTGLPDTHFGIDATTSTGDGRVVVEATVTGTHTGLLELPHGVTLEPTGRSVSLAFVLLMRFVDGLLVHERLLFDHHELIDQLTTGG